MEPSPVVLLTIVLATAAGCGAEPRLPERVPVRPTSQTDGGPRAMLIVSGRISAVNAGHRLRVGRRTLSHTASRDITVYEPFQKRRMTSRVIPFRDAVALDDSVVDVPIDVATTDGAAGAGTESYRIWSRATVVVR